MNDDISMVTGQENPPTTQSIISKMEDALDDLIALRDEEENDKLRWFSAEVRRKEQQGELTVANLEARLTKLESVVLAQDKAIAYLRETLQKLLEATDEKNLILRYI